MPTQKKESQTKSNKNLFCGNILISEPFIQDAYFFRSVVLLIRHDLNSSTGLVYNKKTDLFLNDFIKDLEFSKKIPLYLGGPVHQEKLFFIHSFENVIIPNSIEIKEGLFFDGDFDTINSLLLNNPSIINKQIKFFLGYAGWSTGQLNEEIAQNSWLIGQTDNRQIFKSSGDELWKEAVKSVGGPYEKWLHFPKAPYLN